MPDDINSIFEKGKELFSKKKYSPALKKFNQVLKMDPDNELGWVYKVKILQHKTPTESALLAVNEALELYNSNAELWILKAEIMYVRTNSTYEETLNCCKEALRLNPNAYWFEMARINERFRHYKEAIDCVDEALATNVKQSLDQASLKRLKLALIDALEYGKNYHVPVSAFIAYLLFIPPTDKILYTTDFRVKKTYTSPRSKLKTNHFSIIAYLTDKGMVYGTNFVEWKYLRLKKKDGKLVAHSSAFTLARSPIFETIPEFNTRLKNFNNDLEELLKGFNILDLKKWKQRL